MKKYMGYELGRVMILNLERDDLLLETIEQELRKSGIKNALLTSAIGSLQKVVLHRVVGTGREPEDEFVTLEKPMELASLREWCWMEKRIFIWLSQMWNNLTRGI